jgi:hypothetical protein
MNRSGGCIRSAASGSRIRILRSAQRVLIRWRSSVRIRLMLRYLRKYMRCKGRSLYILESGIGGSRILRNM